MSNTPTKEPKDKKVRVFALAKELNLESKVLVDLCKELGFAGITNQLNGLEPDQVDAVKDRVKKGPAKAAPAGPAAPAKPHAPPPPPKVETKIPTLAKPKPAPAPRPAVAADAPAPTLTPPAPPPEVPVPQPGPTVPPVEPMPASPPLTTPDPTPSAPPVPDAPASPVAAVAPPAPAGPPPNVIPPSLGNRVPNLNARPPVLGGKPPVLGTRPPVLAPRVPPTPPAPAPAAPTPAATTPAAAPPAAPKPAAPVTPVTPAATTPPAPPRPATPPTLTTGPATPPAQPARPVVPPTMPSAPPTLSARPANVIPPGGVGGPARPASLNRPPTPPPPTRSFGGPGGPRSGPPSGGPSRPGMPPGGPAGGPRPGFSTGPAGPAGAKPPAPPPRSTPGQSVKLTPEMIDRLRKASQIGQKVSIKDLHNTPPAGPGTGAAGGPGRDQPNRPAPSGTPSGTPGFRPARDDGGTDGSGGDDDDKKKGPGGVIGRDSRHRGRQDSRRSAGGPRVDRGSIIIGSGGVETIDERFGSRRGPRAALLRKHMRKQEPIKIEGKVKIAPPINVRSLSEAIGMKAGELGKRLMKETGQLYGVNSGIAFDVAALIAAEKNIELVLDTVETAEDKLLSKYRKLAEEVDPEKLVPRPPVVVIMGHVDHGKTSLLDQIRKSKVVDTEAGGITQVIRAWSVMHHIDDPENPGEKLVERPITFLDTPGHEAFTKMRARGANVTDIAVIVVAATDGVMPQTEEAIAHAKAAGVRIVVAINKVDMPNANIDRTRRQLYGLELLPDNMGGDTQFVETSAATGQGIDDLLTALLLEAELNLADKLRADPGRPATGTCLEAYMSADEGVMATVLVQQGTLHRGDIVLCGSSFGRVRAMYNDMGRSTKAAGPSTPVRITGLSEVPNADDPFYVVAEVTEAREIADARRQKMLEASQTSFTPVSLESLTATRAKAKVAELKVILKAEARGSVEAIRKELEKLTHEEVRVRVLHAGIGAITESDIQLALTSPQDTLVIGFNVTADDQALRLCEERGLPTPSEYQIIYKLTDDVKAALEGKLKPTQEVVHLGRAVVRQTFKVGRVGTIAGCYVTSGVVERNSNVRLIREGVVVFPQGEKEVKLDSLKRFKDDAKEVREGFECGMKIAGYDDIKVGDVIEAYKIEIKKRTL